MRSLALILMGNLCAFASYHARQYAWGFEGGNHITNWSFEERFDNWLEVSGRADTRFDPKADSKSAHSGLFVAKVDVDNISGSGHVNSLATSMISLKPNSPYTLSFYTMGSGILGKNFLAVNLFSLKDESAISSQRLGADYANSGAWSLHRFSFTTGVEEIYARIYLHNVQAGGKGTVYFDDVVLEEGDLPPSDLIARRRRFSESVQYLDGLGRAQQSQSKIWIDEQPKYQVSGATFDPQGRPSRSASLYVIPSNSLPGFQPDVITGANQYYDGVDAPDAGGFAYSEVEYASEPGNRVTKSGAPGAPWKLSGPRPVKSGFHIVGDLTIPGDIENGSTSTSKEYILSWAKDEDLNYSLAWKNRMGELVQTAVNKGPAISVPENWSIMKFEYYPGGRPKKSLTPLDVASGAENFQQVNNFNSLGQLTSSYSQDRGLVKSWYNLRGQLRFSQNQEQRLMNEYTYWDYDNRGRLVSVGGQVIPELTQAMADKDAEGVIGQNGKVERVGYIHDGLSAFEQRTGVPLDEVIPAGVNISQKPNLLACQYHTNVDAEDIGFGKRDRLVADFYEYDERGRTTRHFKYLGPIKGGQKLQGSAYSFDIKNRPLSTVLYNSVLNRDTAVLHEYHYDEKGRVDTIRGKNGAYVARYDYLERGPLSSVRLGGGSDLNTGLLVEYKYHVRGWLQEIKATQMSTGHQVFQQNLGYEAKAMDDPGVPSPVQALFGGKISQQLYKLTSEVAGSVRFLNYRYDPLGRMTGVDSKKNAGAAPLGSLQELLFPLSFAESADLDADLDYDLNGRITGKRAGGVSSADSAVYFYNENSYTLDHVTGKIALGGTRDLSMPGNFDYDIRGALVEDNSKNLKVRYGLNLMPSRFDVDQEDGHTLSQLQFFDASGSRVSKVMVSRSTTGFPNYLVGSAEQGEAADLYHFDEIHSALSGAQAKLDALPESKLPDTVRLFVVPPAGIDIVAPVSGEIEEFLSHGRKIPLVMLGILKFSQEYYDLIQSQDQGERIEASHQVTYSGRNVREIRETYGLDGNVSASDTVNGLFGRGAKIGRILPNGSFQFFVKNNQGSSVRTVSAHGEYMSGSVYEYGAYGRLVKTKENSDIPATELWTGKELDSHSALYYFGARFYDPDLGLWLTPDAAGQYNNPYNYGGDPVNFVDFYGLWSLGLGIVIGYDKHGWHAGLGAAVDVDVGIVSLDVNASHTWSTDGSQTSSLGAGAGIQLGIIGANAGLGGAYNTKDGLALNAHVGANVLVVGAEIGTNQAWDTHGNYLGGNVYGEGYLGIKGLASYGGGYELGWGGFRSGWYQNASLALNNWSNHGNGWDYNGFEVRVPVYSYDSKDYVNNAQRTKGDRPGGDDNHYQDNYGGEPGDGKNLGGSNYMGPDNPLGDAPFTSDQDIAAYNHDNRYGAAGAKGVVGALMGRQSGVAHADRALVIESLGNLFRYSVGGGNDIVSAPVNIQTYMWTLGVVSAFSVLNTNKGRY